ncbi:MAG: HAD-IIIA family hydrolase [Rickettsiales bacterium]|nr:HAD-IIIA family hydrolase [Rickettsiales bacterium]
MLVLLDRDGVINVDRPDSVTAIEQFLLEEGAGPAIARFNANGIKVAVVTNQSIVGRGIISQEMLDMIHNQMRMLLEPYSATIDALYCCPDDPAYPTNRRKPAPGMLHEALQDFNADAEKTPFVGDALRDLEAAEKAGCPRVLVRTGKGKETEQEMMHYAHLQPVQVYDSLAQAAPLLIERMKLS